MNIGTWAHRKLVAVEILEEKPERWHVMCLTCCGEYTVQVVTREKLVARGEVLKWDATFQGCIDAGTARRTAGRRTS